MGSFLITLVLFCVVFIITRILVDAIRKRRHRNLPPFSRIAEDIGVLRRQHPDWKDTVAELWTIHQEESDLTLDKIVDVLYPLADLTREWTQQGHEQVVSNYKALQQLIEQDLHLVSSLASIPFLQLERADFDAAQALRGTKSNSLYQE